jgi:hypothetical protein
MWTTAHPTRGDDRKSVRRTKSKSHDATPIDGDDEPADAFIDDTAKKTGKSRATVASILL